MALEKDTNPDPRAIPTVTARLGHWPNGVWKLTILCPYCNRLHHHGGGSGATAYGGHRHAHCTADRWGRMPENGAGYEILIPEVNDDRKN